MWREFDETRNYGGTIGDLDPLLPLRGVGFPNSISLLSLKHPKRLRFLISSLDDEFRFNDASTHEGHLRQNGELTWFCNETIIMISHKCIKCKTITNLKI